MGLTRPRPVFIFQETVFITGPGLMIGAAEI